MPNKTIFAIDPGTEVSAWVLYDVKTGNPKAGDIVDNDNLLEIISTTGCACPHRQLAVEMVASYGMPVGATTFETVLWIGRFIQQWRNHAMQPWRFPVMKVYRKKDVCMHLCMSTRAKDANVNQAIWDRYGGDRKAAVGTKKAPGICYGYNSHLWAALAVAITAAEIKPDEANLIR